MIRKSILFIVVIAFVLSLFNYYSAGAEQTNKTSPALVQSPKSKPVRTLKLGDSGPAVEKLQKQLTNSGWPTWIDGEFGSHTQKTVMLYQKANGLIVDGIVGPQTRRSLRNINGPISVSTTPVRIPSTQKGLWGLPFAPPGLDACQEMEYYMNQFELPARFGSYSRHQHWVASDGLGWREAKCQNNLSSSTDCCVGYWQLYFSQHMRDHRMAPRYAACEIRTIYDYWGNDPLQKQKQACAAKALYDVAGLSPWKPL